VRSGSPPSEQRWCPSARCEEGALLLGIVGDDGVVSYLTPRLSIDAAFVRQAYQGRAPEKRFRFAQPCAEGRCAQWTGRRCGVIDRMMAELDGLDVAEPDRGLPACALRHVCRWFSQAGARACAACPLVITDLCTAGVAAPLPVPERQPAGGHDGS
jgi:hypothetical protein